MGIPRATIAEGDNCNRDDGEDSCASMATRSAHHSYEATTHREAEAVRHEAEAARGREAVVV